VPYPVATIGEIARRHNLHGEPELLPNGGMVNEAWRIGDHILRICILEDGQEEAERESVVVPLIIEHGIRAPKLVAFELKSDLVMMPYTIYERVPTQLLGYCDIEPESLSEAYREMGREIARLGRIEIPPDVCSRVRPARALEPWKTLAKAMAYGKLETKDGFEISKWLEFIETKLGTPGKETMIHMDMHPWNVFVDPEKDELTAIIDWGDTSIGDPALEFASMPVSAVPAMYEGYLEEGGEMDEGFIARTLRAGVSLSMWELRELTVDDFQRRWWRWPKGGWSEMKDLIGKYWPEYLPQASES
jgi:hygromycin-B 7''-O-kinase